MKQGIQITCFGVLACCILIAAGCGGGGGGSDSEQTSSISFTVQWADKTAAGNPVEPDNALSAAMPDDCAARGVASFQLKVNDNDGATLKTGTFDCSANQGTLDGIPTGTNYTIIVSGLNSGGGEIYRGQKTGVTLAAGSNNIGVIVVDIIRITFKKLPDTGQTKSYTNTVGEDHDYTINPPSYTKLDANGKTTAAASWVMIRDNVTGLIWENKTDDGTLHDRNQAYDWSDAQSSFINALNIQKFGGFSDWRLPTIMELSSLVNAGASDPAVKTTHFPNIQSSVYWSSTTYANYTDSAWLVDFSFGDVLSYSKFERHYVLAVRGGA